MLNSYSQVFFSNNPWFAVLLLLASFTDPFVGLSGLLSVLISVLAARLFGLDPAHIRSGIFSFNSLLSGFAVGAVFHFNGWILVAASLLTLLLSAWISGITLRHKLPFLSLPFILASWILFLNSGPMQVHLFVPRNFTSAPCFMHQWAAQLDRHYFSWPVALYFKSLSAVFFQNNSIAGLLIALGLLIHSRIAFSLSLLGFAGGFIYFKYFLGHPIDTDYYYTAFNYILTYIAIGGFFLLPSRSAYMLALAVTPVIGLFAGALSMFAAAWHLPVFSLSFSLVTMMVVAALNNRYHFRSLVLAQYQLYSPEKNLYAFHSYTSRFKNDSLVHIHLPFFGEWTVSQGHEGELTHKKDWRHAWDFVVTDEHSRTFRLPGKSLPDFYCYGLPVLAPADGTIVALENGVEDNAIGEVNLSENWGNTLVIKHADYLYSKISHLKKDSFRVKEGDAVKKGDLLALCGNSGRSPEPHIHFQLQDTPYVGSKTLRYPISYYVSKRGGQYRLHTFEEPEQGEVVLKPGALPLLKQGFNFAPGETLSFEVKGRDAVHTENWEVVADELNATYLLCARSGSRAYFTNNDTLFYFTAFTGDKSVLLYYFYLGAYKLLLSYFPGMVVEDALPVEGIYQGPRKWLQDLLAPFYIYMKPLYRSTFENADDPHHPTTLKIDSGIFSGRTGKMTGIKILLADHRIQQILVTENNLCITATRT
jgi:urea transporter/murein DD-endopeptidase MepM/ murein hydrolase activator NlpD